MPKANIDYSETSIYKIYCKDDTITDIYVGHTTNFYVRKYQHKNACNAINNEVKIYKTIRANGGWDNWDMVEIAKYNCKNSIEARIKEQYHYVELKASLNSIPPYVNNPNTDVDSIIPKKLKKTSYKYVCESCNFACGQKIDWDRHIVRPKHNKNLNVNINVKEPALNFFCKCEKTFQTNAGLWKHKKKCLNTTDIIAKKNSTIDMLIIQNNELIELLKNGFNNTPNNNINANIV
jgi:hypothetical protein